MNIEPPGIPYNFSDLEPALSRDTLVFHSLRHQRVYLDRILAMVRGTAFEAMALEELIRVTERTPTQHAIYRCAAEVWNQMSSGTRCDREAAAPRPAWSESVCAITTARTRGSRDDSRTRPALTSAAAGFGSSGVTTRPRSSPRAMPVRRWCAATPCCWPLIFGSTPTTSTTRTAEALT